MLYGQKIRWVISIFWDFNLLKFVLWPPIWSVLVNISCALEMSVYSIVSGCSVLYTSDSFDSLFLCPYWYSTYYFCWLTKEEYWSLQLQLHIYPFLLSILSVFASCFLKPMGRNIHIQGCCIFLVNWCVYYYAMSFLITGNFFVLKCTLILI